MEHPCIGLARVLTRYLGGMTALIVSLSNVLWPISANAVALDVTSYVTQGYAVDGPFEVVSATSGGLTLASAPEDIVVDLNQKTVLARDQYANTVSFDAVTAGKRIYVLRKGNQVVVFLLPAPSINNTEH